MKYINYDKNRYLKNDMPIFQKMFRRYWDTNNKFLRLVYKILFRYYRNKNLIDMSIDTKIGEGLYIDHHYCITINPKAVIGKNCNIHKGVTIGQENRGVRKGTPVIGDEVWIGINSTIVGNVKIGNDVLISPNSFVNCDIPDHSIVFGNPCIIKHRENATKNYINRKVK